MEAILSVGGVPVPPQPHFTYQWWQKTSRPDAVFTLKYYATGDNGHGTHTVIDDPNDEHYRLWYYCIINGSVVTDTIMIPWWRVAADQRSASGAPVGTMMRWKLGRFVANHAAPDTFYVPQDPGFIILQADTGLSPARDEKFHHWWGDNYWLNYEEFAVGQLFSSNTAQMNGGVVACTIRTALTDGPGGASVVQFRDPWYRDTVGQYGLQNRGLEARFHSWSAPFVPNTRASDPGSEYKGVFKDHSGPPSWTPPTTPSARLIRS